MPGSDGELRRLHEELSALQRHVGERDDLEQRQDTLIALLRQEAVARDVVLDVQRQRVAAAERELDSLRAIRDALTPAELPRRSGLELAAVFLPAIAESVSGDFYLVAEGPEDSTVLIVGDVMGHGLQAARRAAFVRTAFAASAPFSDDPCRLLSWANTALIERAGISSDFVTAACVTYLPRTRLLRWAYAGHPPAMWLDDGRELSAAQQGIVLGIQADLRCEEGSLHAAPGAGLLLYTDGLIEARHDAKRFGVDAVSGVLSGLDRPSPAAAIAVLRARVAEHAYGARTDDLCMLAARIE